MEPSIHPHNLQSIEENFQAFHGHLPVASFWKDASNTNRGCNQALITLLGLEHEHEVVGRMETELIDCEDWSSFTRGEQSALETGQPSREQEVTIQTVDERVLHLEIRRIPLRDVDSQAAAILVTYDDLTHQRGAEQTVAAQKAALEERANAIEFDLDSAQQIQKFLMGRKAEQCPFLDVAFDYRYMEKVGGDYLSFKLLNDGSYSILLADLTGHGVTAALFMAMLKYISQETPEEVRTLPSYFFNYLDMEFYEQIPNGFFTAFSASAKYEETTERIQIEYATAAHPAAIIIRRDGTTELLESGDFAIGLLDLVERQSHAVELAFGDRLYAYTDGFIETRNPSGEEFGLERLQRALVSFRDLPLKQSISKIYETLQDFSESDEYQDDMTIFGIEAKANEPAPEILDDSEDVWGCN